jgi:hypothetical protein
MDTSQLTDNSNSGVSSSSDGSNSSGDSSGGGSIDNNYQTPLNK